MPRKISLELALQLVGPGAAAGVGNHLSAPELYDLLRPTSAPAAAQPISHLIGCPVCAHRMREMAGNLVQAETQLLGWDLALPKAASTPGVFHWRLPTDAGKYTIAFHPHVSDPNRGIISLQVAPQYRDLLEGHHVSLRDSSGHLLLAGKIVNGEAVQEVADISQIEVGFVVRTD